MAVMIAVSCVHTASGARCIQSTRYRHRAVHLTVRQFGVILCTSLAANHMDVAS